VSEASGIGIIRVVSFRIELGFVLLFSVLLLFGIRAWLKAPRGSSDRWTAGLLGCYLGAQLLGLLARVVWPDAESVHNVASLIGTVALVVMAGMALHRGRLGGPSATALNLSAESVVSPDVSTPGAGEPDSRNSRRHLS